MSLWISEQFTKAITLVRSKREDERGAELLEYIAMGGLAVIAIVALFTALQTSVFPTLINFINSKIQ